MQSGTILWAGGRERCAGGVDLTSGIFSGCIHLVEMRCQSGAGVYECRHTALRIARLAGVAQERRASRHSATGVALRLAQMGACPRFGLSASTILLQRFTESPGCIINAARSCSSSAREENILMMGACDYCNAAYA